MGRLAILGLWCWIGSASAGAAQEEGADFFETRVRPLLVERCASCHGEEKPKGGLRLDSREAILTGGDSGPAAEPGKPEESLLVQALSYNDQPQMPPKGKLPDAEIETIRRWVEMGMPWPSAKPATPHTGAAGGGFSEAQLGHWAFQPRRDPQPPAVTDGSLIRNAIDRFVVAGLEGAGLKPAREADRRTLIRRLAIDLTGLPPSPEEVEAFVADTRTDAYERVVDRLLASPAYGERWARHWLDVVRYADSLDARGSGQPGDILDAWRYRDFVVDAFNSDVPYDRFVALQLAGDVIPPSSASEGSEGFNRAGTIASTMLAIGNWGNGDADKDKILTDIADDQVDVVSKAFLGLTISCARCHDHKFDPISQADYYGMAGIFFSTHILPKLTPKGAGETIIRVPLVSSAEMKRREEHAKNLAAAEAGLTQLLERRSVEFSTAMQPHAARHLMILARALDGADGLEPATLEWLAKDSGVPVLALRGWAERLGSAPLAAFGRETRNLLGTAGVTAWLGQGDTPSATVNANADAKTLLTFTLPGRSVSVHPGPASAVVVAWTSPMSLKVGVRGRLADGDMAGGDGVAWTLAKRSRAGLARLGGGEFGNGGSADLTPVGPIEIREGEQILLRVLPRAEYTCDTTTVRLVIEADDGSRWDLTSDALAAVDAGTSTATPGRAGVWSFAESRPLPVDGKAAGPLDEALGAWQAAVASGADEAAVRASADRVQSALKPDDPESPYRLRGPEDETVLAEAQRAELAEARAELARLRGVTFPPLEYANAAQEGGVPESPHAGTHDVRIHHRGRYDRLGEVVARRFPTVLAGDESAPITEGSGRKELAEWLTRPDHRLTPRVIVNRLWQHHFGQGIVRSPSNFGLLGERPTHPELLDWLAARLVDSGWSLKAVHRLIVTSATYRQSSVPEPQTLERDPENRWLGRMNRRRLESESLRDALLGVSGELDRTQGGPAIREFERPRRGLYMVTIRSDRATYGALFDQADSTAPVDRRTESTVAPQALFLMNNGFVETRAQRLAERLEREAPAGPDRIDRAYRLLFGRPPTEEELAVGQSAVADALAGGESERAAWAAYAHVLLLTNEFVYVD